MKKQLLLIVLLILQSFAIFIPSPSSDWIIDGDTVYIDDENVYLSATPHTITKDTWVTFKLRSKDYEGDIDACWLFDTTNCKPRKPVYYKVGEGDWTELTKEFTIQTIDFENMTKAYLLEDITIQKDINYSLKCYVDTKFNTNGKYWWGVKPSHLGWDKGYYIDPWWNVSYNFRRRLTINSAYVDAPLIEFPIFVNISAAISAKCDDGKSIRFLNDGNTTEYYYQIEDTWNSASYNHVWVNISSISNTTDTILYLYYNNSAATDNQTPTLVWDKYYLGVYHMNESAGTTCNDSTANSNDGTFQGNLPTRTLGKIGYGQNFTASDSDYITLPAGCHTPKNGTIEVWTKVNGATGSDQAIFYNRPGDTDYIILKLETSVGDRFEFYGRVSNVFEWDLFGDSVNPEADLSWHGVGAGWAQGAQSITVDVSLDGTDTGNTGAFNPAMFVGASHLPSIYFNGRMDELRISNLQRTEAWINATLHSINNQGFLTFGAEEEKNLETVINATTGIEGTNATLNGYVGGAGTGVYDFGFWIGTTDPLTEGNADRNMTGGTVTIPGNSDFSHNDANLSKGTHYYARAWVGNATHFASSSGQSSFWTKCNASTGFTATASGCNVDLAWTKGAGAVNTVVVRRVDAYPIWPTNGTIVYNNTGTSYSDTGGAGNNVFYRVWSWAGDKLSDDNITANLTVPPCPPTSVTGSVLSNMSLRISWTKGTGANTTVVRKKEGSFPSSVTDGTQMCNSTVTQVVESDLAIGWYFRLWSYANGSYSTAVDSGFGALIINTYSEEDNSSLEFDVLVRNESGTQSYESRNNTNPLTINILDNLPLGNDIRIIVSPAQNYSDKTETFTGYTAVDNTTITYAVLSDIPEDKASTNVSCRNTTTWDNSYPAFTLTDDVIIILADAADIFHMIIVNYTHYEYDSRTYYRDLVGNHVYLLDAFLPDADKTELYILRVIDTYDIPVEGADLSIKRSINGSYEIISSPITDADGKASVYLTPSEDHIVTISKSGYETKNASFIPDPDYYGSFYPITFRLTYEEAPAEPKDIADYIILKGTLYTNDTLNVSFYDKADLTINTHFYIYEYYNNTRTYIGEYNGTTGSDFEFWKTVSNTSRMHLIVLFMNHTALGAVSNYTIYVNPLREDKKSGAALEVHFINVFGNWDYGFVNTIIWYFPSIIFILAFAAIRHPGMGVAFAGMYCIFVSWYLLIPDEAKLLTFAGIALVLGIIGIFLKKGRDMIH